MPSIQFQTGEALSVANIFCIGRNYAAHATELGNQVEAEPVVFLKPTSALANEDQAIELPSFSRDIHFEAELVIAIGLGGRYIDQARALEHVAGYGIGLDLTARDVQNIAKQKGLPWTLGKGFNGAACVSRFVPAAALRDPAAVQFSLDVNGERRQNGDTTLMVFQIPFLISYLAERFTLQAGDLIYTGTPAGVAALRPGDELDLRLEDLIHARFRVAT